MSVKKPRKQDNPIIPSSVAGVRLSHPDKILFPEQGVTKFDLASYLDIAWPFLKPHALNRFMSLVRCPAGRARKCFFQRHAGAGLEAFKTKETGEGKKRETYIYLTDKATLISGAQMGVLEFHIWGSKISAPDLCDRLVFDLDPAPDLSFQKVKDGALMTREVLKALGLESLPLLTGGKGLHVVVPLRARHDWSVIKPFARALATKLAEAEPSLFTVNIRKDKRHERIFMDYLRNDHSATAIMPFSPRAREGAPVAWPIAWDDLPGISAANEVSLPDARKMLEKGKAGWASYGDIRQNLSAAALKALDVTPGKTAPRN